MTNKDVWGRQALRLASGSGSQEICSKLLKLGARSDQLDENGKSPVDYFVESTKRRKVKGNGALIKDGEAATESRFSKVSYLNVEESREFFRFAMESPACRYSHGQTFLHSAVEVADPSMITILLKRHFDLEAQDDDLRTPLHYAVLAGRVDMVTALISGFDVDVCVGNALTRKHFSVNLSAADSKGTTALMLAVEEKLMGIISALLSEPERIDIHQVDADDETVLFYAHDLQLVEYLVEKGFNTTARDSAGRTRLHTAIIGQEEDIASYLVRLEGSNKIQNNTFDNEGDSLLIAACRSGLSELIEPIDKRWGNLLNEGDRTYNQSPLAWACEGAHTSVVKKLLTFEEVDVNRAASESDNLTPLHLSVWGDKTEILDRLLEHKNIDLSRKDALGKTALERAVHSNRTSTARKLLLHDQTAFAQRIKAFKGLVSTSPKRASKEAMTLVSDGLKSIKYEKLISEFLVWLVSDGTSPPVKKAKTREGTTADTRDVELANITLPVTDHVEKPDGTSADTTKA